MRELELERKDDDVTPKSDIVEVFTKHKTVERLLDAVKRRGPNISVFLQVREPFYLFMVLFLVFVEQVLNLHKIQITKMF